MEGKETARTSEKAFSKASSKDDDEAPPKATAVLNDKEYSQIYVILNENAMDPEVKVFVTFL